MLYAFSRPFLLNEQIQISENQTFYKHHILKVIMKVPLMCFLASIASLIVFQLVGGDLSLSRRFASELLYGVNLALYQHLQDTGSRLLSDIITLFFSLIHC